LSADDVIDFSIEYEKASEADDIDEDDGEDEGEEEDFKWSNDGSGDIWKTASPD